MRRFLIFLVVLVGLLIAADRISCIVAQREIGKQIQGSAAVSRRPGVTVHGFPFLTQALRGRYTRIDADLSGLAVENGLTVNSVHVEMRGLRVKPAEVIGGSVSDVPVDSARSVATVTYAALDQAARANVPDKNLTVKFGPAANNLLSIDGDYAGPALKAKVSVQAQVSVKNGRLVVGLQPDTLAQLPTAIRAQLDSLVGDGYELPRLPLGFKATTVTVGPSGITVTATATSVNLG